MCDEDEIKTIGKTLVSPASHGQAGEYQSQNTKS